MNTLQLANQYQVEMLKGKYITNEHIVEVLDTLNDTFEISICGTSVKQKPIYAVQFGTGSKKVLMWSQMHGNEPTTTKGLFDFFNLLNTDSVIAKQIASQYTLLCIPILNPDGAEAYTRVNANEIDLNRDASTITQPESKVLRGLLETFKPDLCFNLHDQRTVFGTEGTGLPATISFLAPAFNEEREYNATRLTAISTINKMNAVLKNYIPNQIGRFDDTFNVNCTGDYITSIGIPTILFEAGHFQNDYNREESRKYVFIALLTALVDFEENEVDRKQDDKQELENYLRIPQNSKYFYDFIYRNIKTIANNDEKLITFAAQFEEKLVDGDIQFVAKIVAIDKLDKFKGHVEIDGKGMSFTAEYGNFPKISKKADFYLNNMLKFINGLQFL
jgi:hypothetical protein